MQVGVLNRLEGTDAILETGQASKTSAPECMQSWLTRAASSWQAGSDALEQVAKSRAKTAAHWSEVQQKRLPSVSVEVRRMERCSLMSLIPNHSSPAIKRHSVATITDHLRRQCPM